MWRKIFEIFTEAEKTVLNDLKSEIFKKLLLKNGKNRSPEETGKVPSLIDQSLGKVAPIISHDSLGDFILSCCT